MGYNANTGILLLQAFTGDLNLLFAGVGWSIQDLAVEVTNRNHIKIRYA